MESFDEMTHSGEELSEAEEVVGADVELEAEDEEHAKNSGSDCNEEDDDYMPMPKGKGRDKVKSNLKKEAKPGIIYLSTVPPGMNIRQIREYFEKFGELNRSFLQPDKKGWKGKGKGKPKNLTFTEGWIEFRKRRHAKRAVATLNNNPVGGKKRKIYHDFLWNIKYLPGFQWVHLNERLAYERISMKQRLRAEISAVKRETDFFAKSIDLSKKLKRKGVIGKGAKASSTDDASKDNAGLKPYVVSAPHTVTLPEKKAPTNSDRASFLTSLFAKGT